MRALTAWHNFSTDELQALLSLLSLLAAVEQINSAYMRSREDIIQWTATVLVFSGANRPTLIDNNNKIANNNYNNNTFDLYRAFLDTDRLCRITLFTELWFQRNGEQIFTCRF